MDVKTVTAISREPAKLVVSKLSMQAKEPTKYGTNEGKNGELK